MHLYFYEKPGCAGNAKQKKLLELYHIPYETHNLLTTSWHVEELKGFFEGLSKEEIINPFAPQIKNKTLDIQTLSKEQLIELMTHEPILIKRPLLRFGEKKICGFDIEKINQLFQKNICSNISISTCQATTKSCNSD